MKLRNKLASTLLVGLLVLGAAACGGGGSQSGTGDAAETSS